MSHTPGPWTLVQTPDEPFGPRFRILPPKPESGYHASLMADADYYPSVPNNPADWHLIAAAPELLEALKLARELTKDEYGSSQWLPAVDAAIAKAEGK